MNFNHGKRLFYTLVFLSLLSPISCTEKTKIPSTTSSATQVADGAKFVKVPLGLSTNLNIPADNPLTPEKVELGKLLYFDKRLSADNTISCATCHDPNRGWSDNQIVSTGIHGQKGSRKSPTILNSTYHQLQFWDGREKTLEAQALGPIANPIEMGNTHEKMVSSLGEIASYAPLFKNAFGDSKITKDRVAQAIASFERTILSGNSKYDQFNAGNAKALNESEVRGKDLFFGKARCVVCHSGPTFTNSNFHNLGVGLDKANPDLGRYVVSKAERDKGAFKTPGLRDVSKTAPYMHDGSEATLEAVVEFYNKGGNKNPQLDPLMTPLNLSEQEKADLVAFMKALDGNPYPKVEAPVFVP